MLTRNNIIRILIFNYVIIDIKLLFDFENEIFLYIFINVENNIK